MAPEVPAAVIPSFDEKKTTEAASVILLESGAPIGPMRLLKLLYLADRKAWEQWERPISYDSYSSLPLGPILSTTYDIIKGEAPGYGAFWSQFIVRVGKATLRLAKSAPITRLSRAEVELLRGIVEEYRSMSDDDLVRFTHTLPEYKDPGNSSIPISLPTVLKSLHFGEAEIARIWGELRAEAQLDAILAE